MATDMKSPPAGMTGAVRSLQWAIQDMNGSVEHFGQSNDHLRRAQNMMAWTTAIFGALLLSGLVWIANDIFHLKDQMMESERRFDGVEAQMTALGTRMDDLNLTIEQIGAELLAARGVPAPVAAGPEVSVLSTPTGSTNLQATANAPLETTALDAAAQPVQVNPTVAAPAAAPAPAPTEVVAVAPSTEVVAAPASTEVVAAAPAPAAVALAIAPSPPAPRADLTPAELAQPSPVVIAAAPADQAAPAAAAPAPAAEQAAAPAEQVAAAPAAEAAPAAAPAAEAAPAADLSDDQLLSYNDDQIEAGDELLLLDENGNPQ
ncbi:MAG: hypothetical protein ACRBM6_15055 [Geminicoccales bacterium]